MGLFRRRVPVPDAETKLVKIPFQNLAAVASHEDGAQLNFRYERRIDANGQNVLAKKRMGQSILSSLAAASTQTGVGSTTWRPSGSTTDKILVALDDTSKVNMYLDVSGTATICKNGATTIDLTTGKEVYFTPVFSFDGTTKVEKLLVFNGTDAVWTWDGAGATSNWAQLAVGAPLSTTIGDFGVFHKNMLFVAKNNDLYISNVGTPISAFTTTNKISFREKITWLHVFQQFVIVFTANSFSIISGSAPSNITTSAQPRGVVDKSVSVGTNSPRSVCQVGDWLYFWCKDRFYRTNLNTVEDVAYDKLRDILDTVVESQSDKFAATEFQGRYECAVVYSSGTTNNRVLSYDPRFDEWVMDENLTPHSLFTYRSSQHAAPTLCYLTNLSTSRTAKVFNRSNNTLPFDILASTTLNEGGVLSATDATITLTSAAEFPTTGTGYIESECITWTGKSSNNLTGVTRGTNNTVAATHADGTTVYLVNTITFQYTTENLKFGDEHMLKKAKYLWFTTKAIGATAVQKLLLALNATQHGTLLTYPMTSGGFILGESRLSIDHLGGGAISTIGVIRVPLPASLTFSLRFSDTQAAGQTEVYNFDFQFTPKKLKTR